MTLSMLTGLAVVGLALVVYAAVRVASRVGRRTKPLVERVDTAEDAEEVDAR